MNSMLSNALTPHTNAYSDHSKPTLKHVERFRNGSICGLYERSIYVGAILSELIDNYAKLTSNELSNSIYLSVEHQYKAEEEEDQKD